MEPSRCALIVTLISVLLSLLYAWRSQLYVSPYVSVWHGASVSPAAICLVFLTNSGLALPEVWGRWYEDARIQMSALEIDPLSEKERVGLRTCTAPSSPFLRAAVSWSPNSSDIETVRANLPCWMHDSIMPHPAQGRWGSTNHVIHAALKFAREKHPDVDLFVIVSDKSVPVKRFHSILSEVSVDRRSRFYIWIMDFISGIPKHAEWFAVTRRHADMLIENAGGWLGKGSLPADKDKFNRGYASEEEYFPLRVIIEQEGISVPPTKALRRRTDWLEPILKPYVQHTPDLSSFHWVHWYEIDQKSRTQFLGDGGAHSARPFAFDRINAGLLKYLNEREGVWMMRKVSAGTIVDHCGMSHMDYATHWLRINEGDGFPYKVTQEQRKRLAGDAQQRMDETCLIRDFLPRLMQFKSSNATEDFVEIGEDFLYYGDRPYPTR